MTTGANNRSGESRPALTIIDRLDACIASMVKDGQAPRAIYLTADDYAEFAKCETEYWQDKLGSTALFWPVEHAGVDIIAEHLIDKIEIPVRQCMGVQRRGSAVYAANGSCVLLDLAGSL